MKVKICGITNMDDAGTAVEAGADALGFIFVKSSPRYVSPERAREIIQMLPPFVTPVGVFADATQKDVETVAKASGIRCLQLHGEETPGECAQYDYPIIKSFRVGQDFDITQLGRYRSAALLLDTFVDGQLGGTGRAFDWEIARHAKRFGRIVLSGGLTPTNLGEAIRKARPYAVDVNSGVESAPGKKDKAKIKVLFETLRVHGHTTSEDHEKHSL